MNREIIELERDKDWKLGWEKMFDYFWTETEVLNKIIEWCDQHKRENEIICNSVGGIAIPYQRPKIYKHLMRLEYEFPDGTTYKPKIAGIVAGNEEKCDRVRYLDIYWQ